MFGLLSMFEITVWQEGNLTNQEMIQEILEHTKQIQKNNGTYEAFNIFQTKWYARILFELCKESPCRFGQLKKAIPEISNVVLTSALRNLEEKNLINRFQFNEIPPHVEYSLTEHGEAMLPIFYEMIQWEKKHLNMLDSYE